MNQPKGFNALFISENEALISKAERYLEQRKIYPHLRQIRSENELTETLTDKSWEIILYEYATPSVNIGTFFDLLTKMSIVIPIVVIGENIGGEMVADLVKRGFSDYVERENLERLEMVILREIERYNLLKRSARYDILRRNAELSDIFGRFAGGIAHNINNMLMVILNNALFIRDNPVLTINLKDDINRIITSVRKGEEFVKNILSIASGHKLNLQILDVNSFVYKVAENIRGTMGRSIDVNVERTIGTAYINVDENLIFQAFRNIALNAKEAIQSSGLFHIKAEIVNLDGDDPITRYGGARAGEYVKFTLSDTGGGIPEDIAPHIFEPCYSTKGRGSCLGLGLPVSYGIIKEHNGIIDFDTTPGKGSNFYIYLPLYKEDSKEILLPNQSGSVKKSKGTVLLVEDDLDIRFVMSRIFTEEGFNTIEAVDGLGALVMLNKVRPQDLCAVVTDVIMPKMNGVELAKKIREKYKDVKIIFISGYPDNDEEILRFTNSIFIQKPITGEMLMYKIGEFLKEEKDSHTK